MYGRSSHIQNWTSTGEAANAARGQLNRENGFFSVPLSMTENLVWRDRFGCPVPRQPALSPPPSDLEFGA